MATLEETYDAEIRHNDASAKAEQAREVYYIELAKDTAERRASEEKLSRSAEGRLNRESAASSRRLDEEAAARARKSDAEADRARAEAEELRRPDPRLPFFWGFGIFLTCWGIAGLIAAITFAVNDRSFSSQQSPAPVAQAQPTSTPVPTDSSVTTPATMEAVFGPVMSKQAWLGQVGKSSACPGTDSGSTGQVGLPLKPKHGTYTYSSGSSYVRVMFSGKDYIGHQVHVPNVGKVAFIPQPNVYETLIKGFKWVHEGEGALYACNGPTKK